LRKPVIWLYDQTVAHIISIANNKGGVGKTTTAINLAAGLAREQPEGVLVVDADAANASVLCWRGVRQGGEAPFQVIGMQQPVIHKELPQLLKRSSYGFVIIDCPASGAAGAMTRSALMVSHLVVIPVQPSGLDLWASDPMVQMIKEVRVYIPDLETRLLINRKAAQTRLAKQVRAGLDAFESEVFDAEIAQRTAIAEAATRGQTIYEFDPGGLAVLDYNRLTHEVLAWAAPRADALLAAAAARE
jgi:chromosome partitioning protein